jgi:hypothetical protein
MRRLTFVSTVTSASATSVELKLNNQEIDLKNHGDTWTGKAEIELDTSLDVLFGAQGFTGAAWSLEVSVDCPDEPKKILTKQDTIPPGKPSIFHKTVAIATDPCASKVTGGTD